MTNPISNTVLTAGDFDDIDDAETPDFVLPPKTPSVAPQAPQEPSAPVTVTKPQDALDRSTGVPPQLVEEVQDNVELLRPVARSMAAINLHNLFVKVQHPNSPTKDRLEFQQVLNKMAGLELKEAAATTGGAGFSIVINIPGSDKGVVVAGTAKRIDDEGT